MLPRNSPRNAQQTNAASGDDNAVINTSAVCRAISPDVFHVGKYRSRYNIYEKRLFRAGTTVETWERPEAQRWWQQRRRAQ